MRWVGHAMMRWFFTGLVISIIQDDKMKCFIRLWSWRTRLVLTPPSCVAEYTFFNFLPGLMAEEDTSAAPEGCVNGVMCMRHAGGCGNAELLATLDEEGEAVCR